MLPLCQGLHQVTVACQQNLTVDKVKEVAAALCSFMEIKVWSMEFDTVLSEATALDPRFKTFAFNADGAADGALERITTAAAAVRHKPSGLTAPKEEIKKGELEARAASQEPQASSVWKLFDKMATGKTTGRNPKADAELEVRSYIEEPLIPRTEDPLIWWEAKASVFPHLIKVMFGRLCTVGTSVPSERALSKRGQIIMERRNCISSSKMKHLVFLNGNLQ